MNRTDRATARRIAPLLERRARKVLAQLPGAVAGDEQAVHEVRVAARRLRAVLPLLTRKPRGRRVRNARRRLRRLTRTFGESRDFDVILGLLAARVAALPASRERSALVSELRAMRTRARRRTGDSVAELDVRALRRELRAIAERSDPGARSLRRLHDARVEHGRDLRAMFGELAGRFDADALHRLRIEARKLRYVAEALDQLHEQSSRAPELLRQIQDDLGAVHDAHVLAEWLATRATELKHKAMSARARQARALAQHFRAQARALHRKFDETEPLANLGRALSIMRAVERGAALRKEQIACES